MFSYNMIITIKPQFQILYSCLCGRSTYLNNCIIKPFASRHPGRLFHWPAMETYAVGQTYCIPGCSSD